MTFCYRFVTALGIASMLLSAQVAVGSTSTLQKNNEPISQPVERSLATLADGDYQLCTEPEPQDWHDGNGACLNIVKQGTFIEGYYGYPHSERFVCLQGQITEDRFHGDGFVISWTGHPWTTVPQTAMIWDTEGRLSLAEASVTRQDGDVRWISFQQADLDMRALYLYTSPRMNSPDQVCDWRSEK